METTTSRTQHYRPYFTEGEVQYLSEKQRGKLSQTQEDRARQQACAFIDAIGAKLGFPKKTMATAQSLYHRFHLFFHRKTWSFFEVTIAALFVSTKIHDTLKKPRDLLMAGYVLRYPELAAKSKAVGGEIEMDPATIAKDTAKILGIERLILESICFNFMVKMPFPYVVKIAKAVRASKPLALLAWRLTIDSNRSQLPLMFPPHAIALGCIYVAALLTSFEQPNQPAKLSPNGHLGCRTSEELATMLGEEGPWESQFKVRVEDLDEIAHILLDLLHTYSSAIMQSSTGTSPSTPSTPSSPRPHRSQLHNAGSPGLSAVPYKPDQLIRLKIAMRGKTLRSRVKGKGKANENDEGSSNNVAGGGTAVGIGINVGTTRFLFVPPGFSGQRPSGRPVS